MAKNKKKIAVQEFNINGFPWVTTAMKDATHCYQNGVFMNVKSGNAIEINEHSNCPTGTGTFYCTKKTPAPR